MKTNNLEERHTCAGCGAKLSVQRETEHDRHGIGAYPFDCPKCGHRQGSLPTKVTAVVPIGEGQEDK